MAKTSSKGINLKAVHSALLEVKSTVSSKWASWWDLNPN